MSAKSAYRPAYVALPGDMVDMMSDAVSQDRAGIWRPLTVLAWTYYVFLCQVSNKWGESWYSVEGAARAIGCSVSGLRKARQQLLNSRFEGFPLIYSYRSCDAKSPFFADRSTRNAITYIPDKNRSSAAWVPVPQKPMIEEARPADNRSPAWLADYHQKKADWYSAEETARRAAAVLAAREAAEARRLATRTPAEIARDEHAAREEAAREEALNAELAAYAAAREEAAREAAAERAREEAARRAAAQNAAKKLDQLRALVALATEQKTATTEQGFSAQLGAVKQEGALIYNKLASGNARACARATPALRPVASGDHHLPGQTARGSIAMIDLLLPDSPSGGPAVVPVLVSSSDFKTWEHVTVGVDSAAAQLRWLRYAISDAGRRTITAAIRGAKYPVADAVEIRIVRRDQGEFVPPLPEGSPLARQLEKWAQ